MRLPAREAGDESEQAGFRSGATASGSHYELPSMSPALQKPTISPDRDSSERRGWKAGRHGAHVAADG